MRNSLEKILQEFDKNYGLVEVQYGGERYERLAMFIQQSCIDYARNVLPSSDVCLAPGEHDGFMKFRQLTLSVIAFDEVSTIHVPKFKSML